MRENHGLPIAVWRAPILNPTRGKVCPIAGIISIHQPGGLNFALNLSNPSPRFARKMGPVLEARRAPAIFLEIRKNQGHPIAGWSGSIVNPNRGRVFPILGVVSSPPLEVLNFALKEIGGILRLIGCPGFPSKSGEATGDLSLSGGRPF